MTTNPTSPSYPEDSARAPAGHTAITHEANDCARAIVKLVEQYTNKDLDWATCQRIIQCVGLAIATCDADSQRKIGELREALQRVLRAFEADFEQVPNIDMRTCWETNSQAIIEAQAILKSTE